MKLPIRPHLIGNVRRQSTTCELLMVHGFTNLDKKYRSQLPRLFELATKPAYEADGSYSGHVTTLGFCQVFSSLKVKYEARFPDGDPNVVQFRAERDMWDFFKPVSGGYNGHWMGGYPHRYGAVSPMCENCYRSHHWHWECPNPCIDCKAVGHSGPQCEVGNFRWEEEV